MARILVVLLGLLALVAVPATASAQTDDESYPPAAIVNLLDPFGCEPTSISGEVGEVLANSTVTLELLINGVLVETVSLAAGADGQLEYTIPVPPNTYGPAIVRASGTDTVNDPFMLETSGTIERCPVIPPTGNSGTGLYLTIGAGAVLAGLMLLAAASRKRRGTAST